MRVSSVLLCALLAGCGTIETEQSATLCVGLCLEIKSNVTKGKQNELKKPISGPNTNSNNG